eukprot:UN20439
MNTKADVDMYMWNNEMYMVNTDFSSTVNSVLVDPVTKINSNIDPTPNKRRLQENPVIENQNPNPLTAEPATAADCQEALDLSSQQARP